MKHKYKKIPARADITHYWSFVLQDIRFRIKTFARDDETASLPKNIDKRIVKLSQDFARFSRSLSGSAEATSAIRTKPLRTYTPGSELRNAEGLHVPFEIAKLYRSRSKDGWKNLKNDI